MRGNNRSHSQSEIGSCGIMQISKWWICYMGPLQRYKSYVLLIEQFQLDKNSIFCIFIYESFKIRKPHSSPYYQKY